MGGGAGSQRCMRGADDGTAECSRLPVVRYFASPKAFFPDLERKTGRNGWALRCPHRFVSFKMQLMAPRQPGRCCKDDE